MEVQRGRGREREERADMVGLKEGEINEFINFPSKYRQATDQSRTCKLPMLFVGEYSTF